MGKMAQTPHNDMGEDKDKILSLALLWSIARSKTIEEFELASTRLKVSYFNYLDVQ